VKLEMLRERTLRNLFISEELSRLGTLGWY